MGGSVGLPGGEFIPIIGNSTGSSPTDIGQSLGTKAEDPEAINALAQIAQQMFSQTSPIREGLIDRSTSFLDGGFDPRMSPTFDFARSNIDQSTDLAKDRILATLPAGGSVNQALTDLEINRANAMTGAASDIFNQEMAQAFQTGFGAPLTTSTASLGSAGAIQSQLAQQNAAAMNQKIGGTKQGAGHAIGSGM